MIDSATPAGPPPRAWPVHLAVAGASLLVGAVIAVAVLLLAGWRYVPVHRYEVTVLLEARTPADRRDAIGASLQDALSGGETRVRTKEEMFAELRKKWEAENGPLPDFATADDMREQLTVSTSGRTFDCEVLAGIKESADVFSVTIDRVHGGTGRVSGIGCR